MSTKSNVLVVLKRMLEESEQRLPFYIKSLEEIKRTKKILREKSLDYKYRVLVLKEYIRDIEK